MAEAADNATTPAICTRIKATRTRKQQQWQADHPGERGNPFTQEQVASRVGHDEGMDPPPPITLGAYGPYERFREPSLGRLRQIAKALYLDEDYFAPSGDLATATIRLEAEADRLHETIDDLQDLRSAIRALLEEEPPAQAGDEL